MEGEVLKLFTVAEKRRVADGRLDRKVVHTATGKSFRSFRSALAFLKANDPPIVTSSQSDQEERRLPLKTLHTMRVPRHVTILPPSPQRTTLLLPKQPINCTKKYALCLFSGIGGMVLGLHSLLGLEHAMYCEIKPEARKVLENLQEKGMLPRAPICSDIRLLDVPAGQPIAICYASVPCQGVSVIGHRNGHRSGLDHRQTGLYSELLRILTTARPPLVFLENVSAICTDSILPHIAKTLSDIGYNMTYVCLPAWAVGARHNRKRWYALCWQDDMEGTPLEYDAPDPATMHNFDAEPFPRMIPGGVEKHPFNARRSAMLGNSVVPQVVNLAFRLLWAGMNASIDDVQTNPTLLTLRKPDASVVTAPGIASKLAGFVPSRSGGVIHSLRPPKLPDVPDFRIVLRPGAVPEVHNSKAPLFEEHAKRLWATPRHAALYPNRLLSKRTTRDLPSQLRFEARTPDADRGGAPNVHFIEHMMGFPHDWTALT